MNILGLSLTVRAQPKFHFIILKTNIYYHSIAVAIQIIGKDLNII